MKSLGIIKRERITVEEHKNFGKELCHMSNRLAQIHKELHSRGYRNGAVKESLASHKRVRLLISDLDDMMAGESGQNFDASIYYPGDGMVYL